MTQQTKKKRPDPFDGSAVARLRRMGLLTEAGEVDGPAMEAFTHVYAASLFDDLCDAFEDRRELSRALAAFQELAARQEPKSIFLMISLQYDTAQTAARPGVVAGGARPRPVPVLPGVRGVSAPAGGGYGENGKGGRSQ